MKFLWTAAGVAALNLMTAVAGQAEVRLPRLISDGMILQQKTPVRIYGTADAGEKVTISLAGQAASTTTADDGKWQVLLKPLTAGGPFTLNVRGSNTVTVKDILVGEVWVCSGQSNMEWPLSASANGPADIAASKDPQLRMFTVPKTISRTPQSEVTGGTWQSASPQTAGGFSAIGYYFARALRASRKVPVGIIHSSWGGTRIEAWMSRPTLEANGAPASEWAGMNENTPAFKAAMSAWQERYDRWKASGSPSGPFTDPGRSANAMAWEASNFADSSWRTLTVPETWDTSGKADLLNIDGAVWYRRTFEVPTDMAGNPALLTLGAIDDFDMTFVNGVKVGGLGPETPNVWQAPRKYMLPAGTLKPGRNVVAVRVWDQSGAGGFTGKAADLQIAAADGGTPIPLSGEWRYKVEVGRLGDPGPAPNASNPNAASVLYNGMLAPLTPYTITGALWYQGESNAGDPARYRVLMPAMIREWQKAFGREKFPFLITQLAPFMAISPTPQDTNWAKLREAQYLTTKSVPNTGLAVITDVGDVTDIHPRRKGPVGERLALLARQIAYGEKIVAMGPTYQKMKVENGKAVLTFNNVGSGLEARTVDTTGNPVPKNKLVGFAVAGADGKFVWADAVITGKNTISVSSPQVPQPAIVRFGWADYPVVNLWSKNGLPAAPFRTDAPK